MTRAEVKIGDWVSYEGKPFQIYDMTRQGDVVWYDEGASSVLMEDIEPIQLTEEILEKNGWKKDYNNTWVIDSSCSELKAIFSPRKEEMMCSICVAVEYVVIGLRKIKHIHELQHLLWALRLDDDLKL